MADRFAKLSPRVPRHHSNIEPEAYQDIEAGDSSLLIEKLIKDFEAEAEYQALRPDEISNARTVLEEGKATLKDIAQDADANPVFPRKSQPVAGEHSSNAEAEIQGGVSDRISNDELQAILDDLGMENEDFGGSELDINKSSPDSNKGNGSPAKQNTDDLESRLHDLRIDHDGPKEDSLHFPATPKETSLTYNSLDFHFPSAPSNDVTAVPQQKTLTLQPQTNGDDADADDWCIICCADADVQCTGCEGDLYCQRCWSEGHQGPDAGYEERVHRYKALEKGKKRMIAA